MFSIVRRLGALGIAGYHFTHLGHYTHSTAPATGVKGPQCRKSETSQIGAN